MENFEEKQISVKKQNKTNFKDIDRMKHSNKGANGSFKVGEPYKRKNVRFSDIDEDEEFE